jgi:hypothetical protein
VPEFDYYIRSSLLGNEVVTEVNKTGRKQKTIIRAGGSELATQRLYHGSNNTVYERVLFKHSDLSGASVRSTAELGGEWTDDGTENAPAELDALGGNVGFSTPYFEITQFPNPDLQNWDYLYNESPMYVNGQVVKATIDGMSVPLSLALHRLNNGSAIPAALAPYQHLRGFRFESNGVGTFSVHIPGYRHITPNGGGSGTNDDPIRIGSQVDYPAQTYTFSFGSALNSNRNQDECKPGQPCPKPRPTPTPSAPANPPPGMSTKLSDCANTVNQFVSSTYDANVIGQSNQLQGWNLLGYAYIISKAINDTHFYATTGFKASLTQFGQNGQVYQHIYGHAAARIIGEGYASPFFWAGYGIQGGDANETGNALSDRQRNIDINQQNNGVNDGDGQTNNVRQESITEEADDNAGRSVGDIISDFRSSGSHDYDKLRKDIAAILCDN